MKLSPRLAAGILAIVACAAFTAIFLGYCFDSLDASTGDPAAIDPGFAFVAIGIAGIVTSALAAWFGVTFPDGGQRDLVAGIDQLGNRLIPSSEAIATVVGWIFFIAYFGVAVFAGYVWWTQGSDLTLQVLKDLVAFAVGAATVILAKLFT